MGTYLIFIGDKKKINNTTWFFLNYLLYTVQFRLVYFLIQEELNRKVFYLFPNDLFVK